MSYRIGICDDEDIFRNNLVEMLQSIAHKNGIQIDVFTFGTINRLENFINDPLEKPLDLIFLDIYMNEDETGIEFAKRLREENIQSELIFVTNTNEYALDGYTVDSKAYLVKPVEEQKLEEAFLRTIKNHVGKKIILKTPSKTITLDPNHVLYIEILIKDLLIHFSNSETEKLRMPLNQVKKKLPENQFFQTHRSYIVSIPAITSIKKREVTLSNGETIPVSRQYYNSLQESLMKWNLDN